MKQAILAMTENWDRETKIVAALCGLSFISHLVIFYFKDVSWPSQPTQYEEWVIETDLAYTVDIKKPPPPKEVPEEKEIPNQLPSNFAIKSEVTDLQKAATVPEQKEEEKIIEEETPAKKAKEEQDKRDALARLLKEDKQIQKAKLSQASRDSVEKKSVNELLKKQKQELMQRQGMGGKAANGKEGMHPYIGELREWIMRFYQIPEIYAERFQDQEFPTLDVTMDAEGNIRKLTVFQASKEETLNQLAIKTVQDASPFPKPPAEFVGRVIRLPFHPNKK